MKYNCPNRDCISGWLYSFIGMMIFPTNKQCPDCNPVKEPPSDKKEFTYHEVYRD